MCAFVRVRASVCLRVYVYTCVLCTYIYVCVYRFVYSYVGVLDCACIYLRTSMCSHGYRRVCVCACVRACM